MELSHCRNLIAPASAWSSAQVVQVRKHETWCCVPQSDCVHAPKALEHSHDDRLGRDAAVARNIASVEDEFEDRHAIGVRWHELRPPLLRVHPCHRQCLVGDLVDEHIGIAAHVGQDVSDVVLVVAQFQRDDRPPLAVLAEVGAQ